MRGGLADGDDPDGDKHGVAEGVEVVGDVFEMGKAVAQGRMLEMAGVVRDEDDADVEIAFGFGEEEADVVAVEELAVTELDLDGDAVFVKVEIVAARSALADQPFGSPAVTEEGALDELVGAVAVGKAWARKVEIEIGQGEHNFFLEPVVGTENGFGVTMIVGAEIHGDTLPCE